MARLDYFLALQSPYVYLAGRRPAEIAARKIRQIQIAEIGER